MRFTETRKARAGVILQEREKQWSVARQSPRESKKVAVCAAPRHSTLQIAEKQIKGPTANPIMISELQGRRRQLGIFCNQENKSTGKDFVTTRQTTISYIMGRIKNRYISSATPRQSAADCQEKARVGEDNKQSENSPTVNAKNTIQRSNNRHLKLRDQLLN